MGGIEVPVAVAPVLRMKKRGPLRHEPHGDRLRSCAGILPIPASTVDIQCPAQRRHSGGQQVSQRPQTGGCP
ncbi:hypothetical protein SDC9_110290 [bioreactor metagenome]|uniref:Uncharacterized protein n=1 Tax=bioreactor metagenome TaxID=1076179 RepID=A0A645BD68_9ZZZZ